MNAAVLIVIGGLSLWPFGGDPEDADVTTIDDLEQQETEIEQEAPEGSDRNAIDSYRAFLELVPDDPQLTTEAMRRLADLQLEMGEKQLSEGDVTLMQGIEYREAVELYEALLLQNPDHARNDAVLYQLARAYENSSQTEQALAALDRMVAQYPDSPLMAEAQFRRGEILFVNKQFYEAQLAYAMVVEAGADGRYYEQSLYKEGWALFKQGEYELGLDAFFALLDMRLVDEQGELIALDSMSRPERELVDDTFRVSTISVSYLDGPKTLQQRLSGDIPPAYAPQLYQRLGALYLEKERYQDAAASFRTFVESQPLHELAPVMQSQSIDAYQQGEFSLLVLEAKEEFVEDYDVDSDYWTQHDWDARIEVTASLQQHMNDLATYYHALSQNAEDPERPANSQRAAGYYRRLIRAFPDDPETPEANFLLAEILYDSGQFAEAAIEYERTAYAYPFSEHAEEAAYAAVLAYQAHEPTLDGEARVTWHRQGIDSALRFAGRFPNHPESIAVQTNAAEQLYQLGELQAALAAAQPILGRADAPPELRKVAWTVDGHVNFDMADYAAAEVAYINVRSLSEPDDPELANLEELIASSVYKQGEFERDQGNLDFAVAHFARVAKVAPASAIVVTADYDAASTLLAMEDWNRAAASLEGFRSKYPDHESVNDIGRSLAETYEKSGQALQAAVEYQRIADNPAEPYEIRREALWHTAELYEQNAAEHQAVVVWQSFINQYPYPLNDSMLLREKLLDYYAARSDEVERMAWLQKIIDADAQAGEERSDYSKTMAAKATLELAGPRLASFKAVRLTAPLPESLKMKKQFMEQALEAYGRAADYGIVDATTEATFQIAEIYHQLSRDLMDSERPAELSGDEIEQYDILLEEQAFPFEEQAIEIHQANTLRASDGFYNEWIAASFDELAQLLPARYAKVEISETYVSTMQ